MATATRDRLIDEAMRLFGEQGYRATSVAQIEAAAGLTPGSGGLYHHFRSKELLLEAGIDRQINRLRALQDIRQIFAGLTDLRSELTVMGRYTLEVLDEESQLLRILSSELHDRPRSLADTLARLVEDSYVGLADWVQGLISPAGRPQAEDIAIVALNALFAYRTMPHSVGVQPLAMTDDRIIAEWVEMVAGRIERVSAGLTGTK